MELQDLDFKRDEKNTIDEKNNNNNCSSSNWNKEKQEKKSKMESYAKQRRRFEGDRIM